MIEHIHTAEEGRQLSDGQSFGLFGVPNVKRDGCVSSVEPSFKSVRSPPEDVDAHHLAGRDCWSCSFAG